MLPIHQGNPITTLSRQLPIIWKWRWFCWCQEGIWGRWWRIVSSACQHLYPPWKGPQSILNAWLVGPQGHSRCFCSCRNTTVSHCDLSVPTNPHIILMYVKKVKWSRYRPSVAQRVDRGIALLFHDRGTRMRCVVSSMPRPHFTPGKDPLPILQEAGWAPGPVWTGGKSRPYRDSIPDFPARSSVAIRTELPGPH